MTEELDPKKPEHAGVWKYAYLIKKSISNTFSHFGRKVEELDEDSTKIFYNITTVYQNI
jgi:hypothetical protein